MNLVIDLGNTSAKVATFENSNLKEIFSFSKNISIEINALIKKYENIENLIYSSVRKEDILQFDNQLYNKLSIIEFNNEIKIPLKNLYETKTTLGFDRLAAAVGGNFLFPNKNLLIIDIGTAITYEFVSEKAEYLGGNIAPGFDLRFKSLNSFTSKLPLVNKSLDFEEIGTNTEKAIRAGVQMGLFFEIESYINYFSLIFNDLHILLTGGDTFFFEKKLKKLIFAEPNLVLIGLNRILDYNKYE